MQCNDIETQVVCFTSAGGVKTSLVAHYEYRRNATNNVVLHATRYTDSAGVNFNVTGGTIAVGECVPVQPQLNVTGGALPFIAGPTRITEPEFAGLADVTDTTAVGGLLQSITVSARGVTDGPSSSDTVFVDLPDGSRFFLMNGQTFTWTVVRDQDAELTRDYKITATGNAYANIGYTFV
jgi:hypothetical protein